jgi:hypothetical protein
MFSLRLFDPDVVEIGCNQYHGQVALLLFADLLGIPGDPYGMSDPSKILFKIPLHLDGHSILEEILLLGNQLRRKVADALLRELTVRRTAKIHFRIEKPVTTFFAHTGGIVLKELHAIPALRAFGLKYGPWFPITAVLSRAFHDVSYDDRARMLNRVS